MVLPSELLKFGLLPPRNHPARRVLFHPDVGVVRHRLRGGNQDQHRPWSRSFVGLLNEAATDALLLKGLIDRQIRQISTKLKVGESPRHSDQLAVVTSCDEL